MEKKPIKRNEHIAKLSRDHYASLMFCFKLRQGVKQNVAPLRMLKYIEYFSTLHFKAHFHEEETILFAPLKDEKVQKAIDDHVVILQKVKDLLQNTSEEDSAGFLLLADLVDDHVRYEERILFPHLEKELTTQQLIEIGRQLSDEAIKDDYEDPFWAREKK